MNNANLLLLKENYNLVIKWLGVGIIFSSILSDREIIPFPQIAVWHKMEAQKY